MVMARLHLICGNCGCNNEWEWEYREREEIDCDVMEDENVWLWCNNCATLHSLNDNAKKKIKQNI